MTQIAPCSFTLKRGVKGFSDHGARGRRHEARDEQREQGDPPPAMVRKIRRARLFPCLLARFRSVGREIRAGSTSPGDGA